MTFTGVPEIGKHDRVREARFREGRQEISEEVIVTKTILDRLRPSTRSLFLRVVIAALVAAPALAAADEGCETLNGDVALVGVQGSPIDITGVDAIAYRHVGAEVVVYERTQADAAQLVAELAALGETNPSLLDEKTWLVAQAPGCKTRPGKTCGGACPGKQTCKRVKKPGRDICQCMLGPSPGPGPRLLGELASQSAP